MRLHSIRWLVATLALVAFTAAACGDDNDDTAATGNNQLRR